MLSPYIVYFKYLVPGEKKPGPVKHFRLFATNWEEARQLAMKQATYPNIEVLRIVRA